MKNTLTTQEYDTKYDFDIRFNKLFYSKKFKEDATSFFGYCSSGLTIDTEFFDNGKINFVCCNKDYGYYDSFSDGINGDIGDYVIVRKYFDDVSEFCFKYIEENDKELYDEILRITA